MDADAAWLRDECRFVRRQQAAASDVWSTEDCVPGQYAATVIPLVSINFPRRSLREVPVWTVSVYGHPRLFNYCPTRSHVRQLLSVLRHGQPV